ncbi:TlpA family protein disulfide reductase [Candidatus Acetothermia bacterium]|nr:TlpA family protein disulfide reductase [Candidatus Acetothermia bacterium]
MGKAIQVLIVVGWSLGFLTTLGFTSYADMIVSGSAEDRKAFERILQNSSGLDVTIDANSGKVSLASGNTPVGKAKFTELLRGVLSDNSVTATLVVGRNLNNVLIGSFEGDGKQLLDLDDIERFETEGTKGLNTQASKVIHEIQEAYEGKKNKLTYDEAHKRAVEAENAVLKDQGSGKRAAAREDCQFPNGAGDFKLFLGWTLGDGTMGFEKYEGKVEFKENKRLVQLSKISFVKTKNLALVGAPATRWGDVSPVCLYEEAATSEKTGIIAWPGIDPVRVGIEVGQFAPNFYLSLYEDNRLRLSNLRGRKVIINFWASWCTPCIAEKPLFQSVVHEGRKGKILMLGINMGETADDIYIFLRQILQTQNVRLTFPIVMDTEFEMTRTYKVIVQPSTYFIDEQGVIVFRKFGQFTKEELEAAVSDFEKQ